MTLPSRWWFLVLGVLTHAPARLDATSFVRGDVNADTRIELSDAVSTLIFLFVDGVSPGCDDAADVDDDGTIVISDPIFLLNFLFLGGPSPAPPYPECGEDPTTDDAFSCQEFPACETSSRRLRGLNVNPHTEAGQDPNRGDRVPTEQNKRLLDAIEPYTEAVRFFGAAPDRAEGVRMAKERGLRVAAGAWIGRDGDENEREIESLIDLVNDDQADYAVVGSEVLTRRDQSPNDLVALIQRVRDATNGSVPLTTADTFEALSAPLNVGVLEACDVIFVNIHPFWTVDIDRAICHVDATYAEMARLAGEKAVIISETGWPSGGQRGACGDAAPTLEEASRYFLEFVSWAEERGVDYFYHEAFGQPWKDEPRGVGPNWGILGDGERNPKPGFEAVFVGERVDIECSASGCRPDEPSLSLTRVPCCGSNDDLGGLVCNLDPEDHAVTVFLRVSGRWWGAKPTWDRPLSPLLPSGEFTVDVTTGGADARADRLAVFVVPTDYVPPRVAGERRLSQEISEAAVLEETVERACR